MKTIYFVRHGESEANSHGLASGSEFDSPLTDKGREQARKTGDDLKTKKIELIISSTLSRAIETAEIIAQEIGYDPKKIIKNELFVERNMGIYSGGPDKDYHKDARSGKPLHESVESTEEMMKRVKEGLVWLQGQKESCILIVAHGGVSRILRLIHQDLPHTHAYKLETHGNAAIYEFTM